MNYLKIIIIIILSELFFIFFNFQKQNKNLIDKDQTIYSVRQKEMYTNSLLVDWERLVLYFKLRINQTKFYKHVFIFIYIYGLTPIAQALSQLIISLTYDLIWDLNLPSTGTSSFEIFLYFIGKSTKSR